MKTDGHTSNEARTAFAEALSRLNRALDGLAESRERLAHHIDLGVVDAAQRLEALAWTLEQRGVSAEALKAGQVPRFVAKMLAGEDEDGSR